MLCAGQAQICIVFLLHHLYSPRCQGLPMMSSSLTSDRCYNTLQRSVKHCLDWYYPIDELHIRRTRGIFGAVWAGMHWQKSDFFRGLNYRALKQLFEDVKVWYSYFHESWCCCLDTKNVLVLGLAQSLHSQH